MSRAGPPESPGRGAVPAPSAAWDRLRAAVSAQAGWLCSPLSAAPGVCWTCRGPADPRYARCFQCGLHAGRAPGLLADAVVPVSYAVKGGRHAGNLWVYKSARPDAGAAASALLALLLVFLRDHGRCAWRSAGAGPPTHVATVPSTRGRAGPHPLNVLIGRCLRLPEAPLAVAAAPRPAGPPDQPDPAGPALDPDAHELQPGLFTSEQRLDGARVLLIDDTWTTGARAQSAAAAAKLAGARHVVITVLGRHIDPAGIAGHPFGRAACGRGFRAGTCAVHPPPGPGTARRPGRPVRREPTAGNAAGARGGLTAGQRASTLGECPDVSSFTAQPDTPAG